MKNERKMCFVAQKCKKKERKKKIEKVEGKFYISMWMLRASSWTGNFIYLQYLNALWVFCGFVYTHRSE